MGNNKVNVRDIKGGRIIILYDLCEINFPKNSLSAIEDLKNYFKYVKLSEYMIGYKPKYLEPQLPTVPEIVIDLSEETSSETSETPSSEDHNDSSLNQTIDDQDVT